MPNTIFKTVSFRMASQTTVSVPISDTTLSEDEMTETEEALKAYDSPGWKRPNNERLLAYVATRFGKEKRFVANTTDALAIALLQRTDMSISRRVLREARGLTGVTVVASDPRGTVVSDILDVMNRRRVSSIHGTEYLTKVHDAAERWLTEKPQGHKDVSDDLRRLIGEALLIRRGVREGDALAEYHAARVPAGFWFKESVGKGGACLSTDLLERLVAGGMHIDQAITLLLRGLQELREILHEESTRREFTETVSANLEGTPWVFSIFGRRDSASTDRYARRRSQPLQRDFAAFQTAVAERWEREALEGAEPLLDVILDAGKTIEQLLRAIEFEIRCLRSHVAQPSSSEPLWPPPDDKPCVASIGIGDLYVVDEEWLCNVAREISYIENARGGESRVRIHERETEEIIVEETERLTEESRSENHQTAERFELQSTVASQTTMEIGVNASVAVSGNYGTTSVQASLGATFGLSRTESAASTVTNARETVSKAASEIRNSVRDKLTKTLRERTLDRNEHRFQSAADNSSVFRFVEKKFRVQVRQYGARLFLELIVPEPGRTLLSRKAMTHGLAPFTLTPDDITYEPSLSSTESGLVASTHYMMLQAQYDARGIVPPPRPTSFDVGLTIDISEVHGTAQQNVKVPEGYRAYDFELDLLYPKGGSVGVYANGRALYEDIGGAAWGSLSELGAQIADTGIIVNAKMRTPDGYAPKYKGLVNVAILARPTNDAFRKWRMDTWLKLRDGYLSQLSEAEARLEEKMSGLSAEDPPARLRDRERSELQRSILKMLTGHTPDYSLVEEADINDDIYTFFQPVACDRRSQTKIAFFDGAFEWHDMLTFYIGYPFAEQDTWSQRMELRTIDEKHRQFLSAGAARVMLPVAPGSEAKVLEFLETPLVDQENFFAKLETDATEAAFAGTLPNISTNLLREILCERNDQYRLGAGSLLLNNDVFTVKPEPGFEQLAWFLDEKLDVGREVMIEGTQYVVKSVTSATQGVFTTGTGRIGVEVDFYLGAVPIGDSWIEYVPTPLVILGGQEHKLGGLSSSECPDEAALPDAGLETAVAEMVSAVETAPALREVAETQVATLQQLRRLEDQHRARLQQNFKDAAANEREVLERSDSRLQVIDKLIEQQRELVEPKPKRARKDK